MKRKTIKKQIKSKLYVAKATPFKGAVRQTVVDEVTTVLMKPQFKKLQKHIERISIIKGGRKYGRVTTGRIVTKAGHKPVYKIFDYDHKSPAYYRAVAVHELAHISWGVQQKWNHEAWMKFNTTVDSLRPVNDYLKRKEHAWRADIRFGEASHYCNEMHSAAAELYYKTDNSDHTYFFPNDQVILLRAFRELHGLTE